MRIAVLSEPEMPVRGLSLDLAAVLGNQPSVEVKPVVRDSHTAGLVIGRQGSAPHGGRRDPRHRPRYAPRKLCDWTSVRPHRCT